MLFLEAIFKLRKRGWEVEPGLLMIKTKKFNNLMDKIARKGSKIWKWFWNIGIIVGIIGTCFIVGYLFINLFPLYSPQSSAVNAVVPLVPGLTIGFETFLRFLIPILIIMISHEIAHGIAARVEKVRIKSSGIIVLLILFGAFVEPDEKEIQIKKRSSRLRIFAAGSFANIIVGFMCFFILSNLFFFLSPFYSTTPAGVTFQQVEYGGPAYGFLFPGAVITDINGNRINNYDDLSSILNTTRPYEQVSITALLNPFYESSRTITLGKKTVETGKTNTNIGMNVSSFEFINGTSSDSLVNVSKDDGNYMNAIPDGSSSNLTRVYFYIDFINNRINPNSISNLSIITNVFLNTTDEISLANFSVYTKTGSKINQGEFNTTNPSKTLQIFFDGQNISDYVNTGESIQISFEVNSSKNNYSLFIDNVNFNVTYSAYYIGLIGIMGTQNYYPPTGPLGFMVVLFGPLFRIGIQDVLTWTFLLSLGIALFNLLPLPPFDGNSMFVDLVDSALKTPIKTREELEAEEERKKVEKKSKFKITRSHLTKRNIIIWSVRIFTLVIFLLNIGMSIFMLFTGQFDLSLFLP
ncbi:MAG: site-2 protease family protein [Candidatus Helarchaeota archaeon]